MIKSDIYPMLLSYSGEETFEDQINYFKGAMIPNYQYSNFSVNTS